MSTPDFKNAPEGATHYVPSNYGYGDLFLKNTGKNWEYFCPTFGWSKSHDPYIKPIPIPQPAKEDWYERGELPPIDTECEVQQLYMWCPCKIVAHDYYGANFAVFRLLDNSTGKYQGKLAESFRPLKSEREKTIENAYEYWPYKGCHTFDTFKLVISDMYDAGMLRIREDK